MEISTRKEELKRVLKFSTIDLCPLTHEMYPKVYLLCKNSYFRVLSTAKNHYVKCTSNVTLSV